MAESAKRARSSETAETEVPPADPQRQVCTVTFCPICMAVTAGQSIRPDAVEHLVAAGREFLLAVTSILGSRAETDAAESSRTTLTRIDIE